MVRRGRSGSPTWVRRLMVNDPVTTSGSSSTFPCRAAQKFRSVLHCPKSPKAVHHPLCSLTRIPVWLHALDICVTCHDSIIETPSPDADLTAVKPTPSRVCTAYLWTQLKEEQRRVLRMGRAFPFKQGGLSLFAVPAPMATQ
ncbi:hypothetical protein EYF80_046145 [Liparis tanakae]|uniref:Uncharacterized protein n=1 Tax=Liparis tanakae TaxID=230148 RepID=A0A4Z2FR03_9TELE|nr:hypothetical protein EYF80_046145 [Liparis tanakae]